MRKYRNLNKIDNDKLSKSFSYLLKENENCSPEECCWVAVTVFDHWLHESDSYHLTQGANAEQKQQWDASIFSFLEALTKIEEPVKYKYLGRYPNKRIQFSQYIDTVPIESHIVELFKTVYSPNLAFPKHGFHIWFENDWTIYIVYQNIGGLMPICELVGENSLFLLPVHSVGHLNQYATLADVLTEKGLQKTLYRQSTKME